MSLTLALLIIVISMISTNTVARENGYDLDFAEEPEYELVNEFTKGGEVIGWSYKINIKIQNTGNTKSQETVINITDEEGVTLSKKTVINPDETKNIIFNWSTVYSKDQTIKTSFYPSDLDEIKNQYNSGSTTFTVIVDEKDDIAATSTPGFELILLLFSMLGVILIKRKNKS